ncbi:MAG: WD40 repeat protein/serine/threonine protein kinase [Verrucomicrobiales bacterium]|jgi:WD40 repeat protein/serine/threonine protein kinase
MAALEIADSNKRTEFIENASLGDAKLKSEINGLLSDSLELDGFLEEAAMEDVRSTSTLDDQCGQQIGPFKLLQKIGEGGCGSVYMADQETPVRRRVALKIIKLGMDTRSVIARFESERQALAMMEHGNIARILDAGATDSGRPYFVMELVRGISITDYADQENLTAAERLTLFSQVCSAIQHAHQKGIIHRDIKPSNILVTLHDGVPVPKIIDFGIAKATEQRLTDKTLFTEYQAFIGTPAYMSPEQAEMSGLDVDTRSDIYSLGVLLYELMVGRTPFDAETLRAAGLDECRRVIREVEPSPPSTRLATMPDSEQTQIAGQRRTSTAHLNHLLSGDLDWIAMKCLEKDRRRRYATVNDLIQDIQRHCDGEIVLARPPSPLYRLQKFTLRHRGAVTAAACLVLTLLGGIAVSTWQMLRARAAEQAAHVAEANQASLLVKAEEGWEKALSNEHATQLNSYIADINLTNHALNEGNFGRALQLIGKHRPAPQDSTAYDFRSFEWRYLAGLCRGDAHIRFPHQQEAIESVSFSPDGALLAAGTSDQVQFWDVRSQNLVTTLPTAAQAIIFLSDGSEFVTASRDSVKIWRTATFSLRTEFEDQRSPISISSDGTRLVTSNQQGLAIWDTTSWEIVNNHAGVRAPMALSPDGRRLATSSRDGVRVAHADTGEEICILEQSIHLSSKTISFSTDGRHVVAPRNKMSDKGVFVVGIWDAETGQEAGTMPSNSQPTQHTGVISNLAFSSDGSTLATGSWDHSIRLWNYARMSHFATLRGQSNEVWSLAFSPDGQSIAAGSKDGSLTLWPAQQTDTANVIPGRWQPLTFSADGQKLVALNPDGAIDFFNLKSKQSTRSLKLEQKAPSARKSHTRFAVAISDNLTTLAHGLDDGTVRIWNTETRNSFTLKTSTARISTIALSPDGYHLVAGSRRQPMTIWDLRNPDSTTPVVSTDAEHALFSKDGSTLITLRGHGKTADVWDPDTFSLRLSFSISPRPGSSIALSPDGSILATTANVGDSNNAIKLWSTNDGALLGECLGHKQGVWSVAFSPNGKTLATSSDDSTLKFWNVATQQELLSIRRIGTTLTDLTFSPDGQWLVASTSPFATQGELRFFRSPSFQEIDDWLVPRI